MAKNVKDEHSRIYELFDNVGKLLQENENLDGKQIINVMTEFLYFRLLNILMQDYHENLDFVTTKYEKTIVISCGEDELYKLDDYKQYFKWDNLMELVNEVDKTNALDKKHLLNVAIQVIFSGIFKLHEKTKALYANKEFLIKKTTTIIKLLKEFDKIKITDAELISKTYESILSKFAELDIQFSQYHTPRWLAKYMVKNSRVKIDPKTGKYTPCLDPLAGTGNILSQYLSHVQKVAHRKNSIIQTDSSQFVHGYGIPADLLQMVHVNMILNSINYNNNIKTSDFVNSENEFNGNVITNLQGKSDSNNLLFLQAYINMLHPNNKIIMALPKSKELYDSDKEFTSIRKSIMKTCNFEKIASSNNLIILIMTKGKSTKMTEFVKVTESKETVVCSVDLSELKTHNYSWDCDNYNSNYNENTDGLHKNKERKSKSAKDRIAHLNEKMKKISNEIAVLKKSHHRKDESESEVSVSYENEITSEYAKYIGSFDSDKFSGSYSENYEMEPEYEYRDYKQKSHSRHYSDNIVVKSIPGIFIHKMNTRNLK